MRSPVPHECRNFWLFFLVYLTYSTDSNNRVFTIIYFGIFSNISIKQEVIFLCNAQKIQCNIQHVFFITTIIRDSRVLYFKLQSMFYFSYSNVKSAIVWIPSLATVLQNTKMDKKYSDSGNPDFLRIFIKWLREL